MARTKQTSNVLTVGIYYNPSRPRLRRIQDRVKDTINYNEVLKSKIPFVLMDDINTTDSKKKCRHDIAFPLCENQRKTG